MTKYRKAMDIPSSRQRRDWKLVRDGKVPGAGDQGGTPGGEPDAEPHDEPDVARDGE